MKFQFIGNACGTFIGDHGTRILCDPWIRDGVFDGSWCHYPPIKTRPEDLKNVDAIYLSHIHPDHFDERYFDWPSDIPIIILNHKHNFLTKKLKDMGYWNFLTAPDRGTIPFREFNITLYAPFQKVAFHNAEVGNLLDSAMYIENGGFSALNANDNTLTLEGCKDLPSPTLAMMNYNAAGPYPSCFDNLDISQKKNEHKRILKRNFEHMALVSHRLKPKYILPFAGAYCLGGELSPKNEYLGTTTWEVCADYLKWVTPSKPIVLRENDTFDLISGLSDKPYVPIEPSKEIDIKYPYKEDEMPDENKLLNDMIQASMLMGKRMAEYNLSTNFQVDVLCGTTVRMTILNSGKENLLICTLDPRLLRRILDKRSHWNNAEIGCHITFHRSPNIYDPDLHTCLQFFHL